MILEVMHRHKKLALESGVEFRPMAPIFGVCVTGLRQPAYAQYAMAYLTLAIVYVNPDSQVILSWQYIYAVASTAVLLLLLPILLLH